MSNAAQQPAPSAPGAEPVAILEQVKDWTDRQIAPYNDSRAVPDELVELAGIVSGFVAPTPPAIDAATVECVKRVLGPFVYYHQTGLKEPATSDYEDATDLLRALQTSGQTDPQAGEALDGVLPNGLADGRDIQALHAGISRRDWHSVEQAASLIRDKLQRHRRALTARKGAEHPGQTEGEPR